MLALGEIRTALLRNSIAVTPEVARRVLDLQAGEVVRSCERPISYAVSPDLLTGVDCRLPTHSGRKVRGIGTVVTHASVTGCRVVQGSTYAELALGVGEGRAPWSHYLSRPGVVEVSLGRATPDDIQAGFLREESPEALDLGAVSERSVDGVQRRPELDRSPPFVARRIALRWTAEQADGDQPEAHFTIASPTVRTLQVAVPVGVAVAAVVELCEDLALHDWLLTTLLDLVERGQRADDDPVQAVESLRPAVDHLLHLWLPGARVEEALQPIWAGFERRPGFTQQWKASVHRVRDQLAMTTARLLQAAPVAREAGTGVVRTVPAVPPQQANQQQTTQPTGQPGCGEADGTIREPHGRRRIRGS